MNKPSLLKAFEAKIASDLKVLTQAALAARGAAIHAESKAEDQYDTRGLEASYLAGAQSKRAAELQELLDLFRYIDVKQFGPTTPISATAVFELGIEGKRSHYLLMPKGGGMSVPFEGKTILTVGPQSPLGEAILGRTLGDFVELVVQGASREGEITAVW